MFPTPDEVRQYILTGIRSDFVQVEGDGQHFTAVIVSPAFEGRRVLERHQLVYAALGERMKTEIHALSMKTFTPEEWSRSHG